jgi:hypothetical protein
LRSASVAEGDSTTAIPCSGKTSPSAATAVDGLIGSDSGAGSGAGRASGAERPDSGTSASSAFSVRATSATIASPIGARAASSGSLVMATSEAPSGSSGPGMFG